MLYTAGDTSLLTEGSRVAIVGSRKATADGIKRAKAVTRALVGQGIIVVSGLAEGIDTVAHRTAIEEGGRTIAVLGTPLSKAYPAKNAGLLEEIKRNHLAISQFPEGYPGKGENFPRRNRTMALICDATIVIEASEKSGTRHQGYLLRRYGITDHATWEILNWKKRNTLGSRRPQRGFAQFFQVSGFQCLRMDYTQLRRHLWKIKYMRNGKPMGSAPTAQTCAVSRYVNQRGPVRASVVERGQLSHFK